MSGDIADAVAQFTKLWNEAADSTSGDLHPLRNSFFKKVGAYNLNAAWLFKRLSSDPGVSGEHIQLESANSSARWVLQLPTNKGLGCIAAENGKSFDFEHLEDLAVDTSRSNASSHLTNPRNPVDSYDMHRPGSGHAMDAVAQASGVVRVQRLIWPRVVGPATHQSTKAYYLNGRVALTPVINLHVQSVLDQWTKVVQPGILGPAEAAAQLQTALGAPVEHVPQLKVLVVGAGVNRLVWLLPDSRRLPASLSPKAYWCPGRGLQDPPISRGAIAVEQIMLPAVACYERAGGRIQLWLVARGEYAVPDEFTPPAGGETSTTPMAATHQTPTGAREERSKDVADRRYRETLQPQTSREHSTSSGGGQTRIRPAPNSSIGQTIQMLVKLWNESEGGLTQKQVEAEVRREAGEAFRGAKPSVVHQTKYVDDTQAQWLEVIFQAEREEWCALLPLSRRVEKAVAEKFFGGDAKVGPGSSVPSILQIDRLIEPMLVMRAKGEGGLPAGWKRYPGKAELREGTHLAQVERLVDEYSTSGARPTKERADRPITASDLARAQHSLREAHAEVRGDGASTPPRHASFRAESFRERVSTRSTPQSVAPVRSDLLAAWRGDWQGPFAPVAKIKKTLGGVAGVTEVFKSAELGALVCRFSDGTAVALPSKRDYANNRTCYQTEATPSVTSRLTDVTQMAEVTPDGQTVMKIGVAVISAD